VIAIGYLLVLALGVLTLMLARLQLAGAPGGDRGVGFAWALLAGHASVLAILLVLTGLLAVAGRLPATPLAWSTRALPALLFVGLSGAAAAAAALAAPTGAVAPMSLAAVMRLFPLLVPLLLTVTGGMLLLGAPSLIAPNPWATRLLGVVAAQTLVLALVLAFPSVKGRIDVQRTIASRDPAALDAFQQQRLDYMNGLDPATHFATILGETRGGNHRTIRESALARIQAVPDWESHVVAELSGPNAAAAFTFLASHDVGDPAPYAAAATAGILTEADRVRARIRNASHSSHLYESLMVFEVDELLAALTKLSSAGVDYTPALREVRAAFAEPADWPHPRYRAVGLIDRWLRKHS
jgi:hypothetical protein